VIVASYDGGHPHIVIINDHSQHIDRSAIRAQQDHIVELVIFNGDITLNLICNNRCSTLGGFDPHNISAFRMFGRLYIPPRAAKQCRASRRAGLIAKSGDFIL
jgi:hypothetical protein